MFCGPPESSDTENCVRPLNVVGLLSQSSNRSVSISADDAAGCYRRLGKGRSPEMAGTNPQTGAQGLRSRGVPITRSSATQTRPPSASRLDHTVEFMQEQRTVDGDREEPIALIELPAVHALARCRSGCTDGSPRLAEVSAWGVNGRAAALAFARAGATVAVTDVSEQGNQAGVRDPDGTRS